MSSDMGSVPDPNIGIRARGLGGLQPQTRAKPLFLRQKLKPRKNWPIHLWIKKTDTTKEAMMKTELRTYRDSEDDVDELLHTDEVRTEPRCVSVSRGDKTEWTARNDEQRQTDDCSTFYT